MREKQLQPTMAPAPLGGTSSGLEGGLVQSNGMSNNGDISQTSLQFSFFFQNFQSLFQLKSQNSALYAFEN